MTKTEIINAVMSAFPDVLNTTVVDADINPRIEPGNVVILVTTDLVSADDQYNLRVNILQRLEPMRPAGVGFEVMVQSRMGGAAVVATTTIAGRTRFEAVAEELTAHISPIKKPPPPLVEVPRATQLFEDVIEVAYGQPSPCPRCKCQAFTMNEPDGKRAACRGCPLPSPMYSVEYQDKSGIVTRDYKCCSCGAKSAVTMSLTQVNLYCWGCKKLTLHDIRPEPKPQYVNELLGVPIPVKDPSRDPERASRIIKGSKAIFKFDGVEIGGITDVEYVESNFDDVADAASYVYKDLPPSEGYTISMTLQAVDGKDWAQTIEQLTKKAAAVYGMTPEQLADKYIEERELTSSPAAGLMEMFREKLGLLPFKMYAGNQRNENIVRRQLKEDDWDRRTGRTTREMLLAIAEFMVSDLRIFCVVGHTERYTKDLANLAREMYGKLNLARAMPIKPLMPNDFDPRYDYKPTQRALVYVDHVYGGRRR